MRGRPGQANQGGGGVHEYFPSLPRQQLCILENDDLFEKTDKKLE
jgi:hypothetical protein